MNKRCRGCRKLTGCPEGQCKTDRQRKNLEVAAKARDDRRAQERSSRRKRKGIDRLAVFTRDLGACALCGVSTVRLMKGIERLPSSVWHMQNAGRVVYGRRDKHTAEHPMGAMLGRHRLRALVLLGRLWGVVLHIGVQLWEADHIVPIAEGGSDDLENLRTLCLKCHRVESIALRARLARRPTKGVGRGF